MKKLLPLVLGLLLLAACEKDAVAPAVLDTGQNIEAEVDAGYENLSVNSRSLVYFNINVDDLTAYIQALGIPSTVEQAINRRLDLASDRFCSGYSSAIVTRSLDNIIRYVTYQSGQHIPTADANYITTQVQALIAAVDAGEAACCYSSGGEICDNGIDDDCDGAIDQADSDCNVNSGIVHDPNGKAYSWKVMPDGKKWLTVNLDYWDGEPGQVWHYNDAGSEPSPGYGMLYDWQAVTAACSNAFGPEWRTPTKVDWDNLIVQYDPDWSMGNDNLFYSTVPYGDLILGGNSGFAALFSGLRYPLGNYSNLGGGGHYWSGTEKDWGSGWRYYFDSVSGRLYRNGLNKTFGFSCRCVKD